MHTLDKSHLPADRIAELEAMLAELESESDEDNIVETDEDDDSESVEKANKPVKYKHRYRRGNRWRYVYADKKGRGVNPKHLLQKDHQHQVGEAYGVGDGKHLHVTQLLGELLRVRDTDGNERVIGRHELHRLVHAAHKGETERFVRDGVQRRESALAKAKEIGSKPHIERAERELQKFKDAHGFKDESQIVQDMQRGNFKRDPAVYPAQYTAAAKQFLEGPLDSPRPRKDEGMDVEILRVEGLSGITPQPINTTPRANTAKQLLGHLYTVADKHAMPHVGVFSDGTRVIAKDHSVVVEISATPKDWEHPTTPGLSRLSGTTSMWEEVEDSLLDHYSLLFPMPSLATAEVDAAIISARLRGVARAAAYIRKPDDKDSGIRGVDIEVGGVKQRVDADLLANAMDVVRSVGHSKINLSIKTGGAIHIETADGSARAIVMGQRAGNQSFFSPIVIDPATSPSTPPRPSAIPDPSKPTTIQARIAVYDEDTDRQVPTAQTTQYTLNESERLRLNLKAAIAIERGKKEITFDSDGPLLHIDLTGWKDIPFVAAQQAVLDKRRLP